MTKQSILSNTQLALRMATSEQSIELLEQIVSLLAIGEPLPEKNRDHDLSGEWAGHRECHILPDWLLIYRVEDDVLVLTLTDTGSHSDLFDN